jgi:cell division protein ZapA
MSAKNDAQVIINGKIYTLSGYESEEYLQKVATYINAKYLELKDVPGFKRQNSDVQRTLIELNIADDCFKAKKQADILDSDLTEKDRQLYEIRHELISAQIKIESLEKELTALKEELNNKEKHIIKIETELLDATQQITGRKSDV